MKIAEGEKRKKVSAKAGDVRENLYSTPRPCAIVLIIHRFCPRLPFTPDIWKVKIGYVSP
jgi:hypothetical protein